MAEEPHLSHEKEGNGLRAFGWSVCRFVEVVAKSFPRDGQWDHCRSVGNSMQCMWSVCNVCNVLEWSQRAPFINSWRAFGRSWRQVKGQKSPQMGHFPHVGGRFQSLNALNIHHERSYIINASSCGWWVLCLINRYQAHLYREGGNVSNRSVWWTRVVRKWRLPIHLDQRMRASFLEIDLHFEILLYHLCN